MVLVAATANPEAIEPSMRRPGRLDVEIEICVPNTNARLSILTKLAERLANADMTQEDLLKVAQAAHGFVGADLEALVRTALTEDGGLSSESFKRAFKVIKPSAMRQVQVSVTSEVVILETNVGASTLLDRRQTFDLLKWAWAAVVAQR